MNVVDLIIAIIRNTINASEAKEQIERALQAKFDEGYSKGKASGEKHSADDLKLHYERGCRDSADRVRDGIKGLLGIE